MKFMQSKYVKFLQFNNFVSFFSLTTKIWEGVSFELHQDGVGCLSHP